MQQSDAQQGLARAAPGSQERDAPALQGDRGTARPALGAGTARPGRAGSGAGPGGERLVLLWQAGARLRSEEHTSEVQSLMRISYAVFCLTKKTRAHPRQLTLI